MRRGGSPIWNTTRAPSGRPADRSKARRGAPNLVNAAQTRSAFAGSGRIHTSRSPVARGTPWAAKACAPTIRNRVGPNERSQEVEEVGVQDRLPESG